MKIFWRVTFNKTAVVLLKDGVNLENELVSVVGSTTCMAGQTLCNISIELKPDNVSNYYSFVYSPVVLNCSLSRLKKPSDLEEVMYGTQSGDGNLTSAQLLCKYMFIYRLVLPPW